MTSILHPYPEYMDSGLPWIGQVPTHWRIDRAKWLFRQMSRPVCESDEVVTCFRDGVVTLRRKRRELGFTNSIKEIGYQGVRKGDLVIHAMDAFAGAVGVSDSDGKSTPVYAICTAKADINNGYYAYVVREMARSAWILALARGIRERSTDFRFDTFGGQSVPIPPPDEQDAIVRFLRAIDTKVNRFIRNRRRLIEVLNEQKQAIINRAVTRGLDPNVPLKASGIEWLGEVPRHWEVLPLKRVAQFIGGGATPESGRVEYWGGEIVWVTPADVSQTDILTDSERHLTEAGLASCSAVVVPPGSIVLTSRAPVGNTAISAVPLCTNQGCKTIVPIASQLDSEYLLVELTVMKPHLQSIATGTTFTEIDTWSVCNQKIVVPPFNEQHAIVSTIKKDTHELTSAIRNAQREIDLIREYRTRLIADVVTGKIDVRQALAAEGKERSKASANIHFRRAVFAAEIVHRLHDEPTFGHVKFEKLIFLAEKRCGVDTGSTYYRQAAGPYDNRALRSIDSQIKKQKWYECRKRDKGYRYVPLEKAGCHAEYFVRYFGNVVTQFDETINTLRNFNTQRCEIVATLYAAWDDLLAQGSVKDDQIIEQVLHHWHPSKQQIEEDRWRRALEWMKSKGFVPAAISGECVETEWINGDLSSDGDVGEDEAETDEEAADADN